MTEQISVFIAEDEAIIRLDLKETLVEEGYAVIGDTGRGDDAARLIEELEPDVAILDINMPGLTGLEVAREVAQYGKTAVVLLTAFSQRELIEEAAQAGALAYLVKPFKRSELVPAVEIARARHREIRAFAHQAELLHDQLEARKVIDRAKGLLIDVHSMSESSAFKFLQVRAMNDRTTMRALAEQVIDGVLSP